MGKLTVKDIKAAKSGRHGDGDGLWLAVSPSGAKKWVFRYSFGGKVTETGLGSAETVTLVQARAKAHEARQLLDSGVNPVAKRRADAILAASKPSFGAVADALVAAKAHGWRNQKHKDQWRSSLTGQAAALRNFPVDKIGVVEVLAVLEPLWTTKPESASRLRQRIEAVLDSAKAQGLRAGENPAAWRGNLAHLLPGRVKIERGHHAAMPYEAVPAFMTRLRELNTIGAMALEFTILTAARTGEVLGALWREIDLDQGVWTIPAGRMKAGKEHRVPLSDRAVEILVPLAKLKTTPDDHVFPSRVRGKKGLSHIAMQKVLARLEVEDATVHGFRSGFRDWCGNETHAAREIVEAALAHSVGNAVEQAYRRSDALEKRRALMAAWADYCAAKDTTNVVRIDRLSQV